MDLTTAQVSPVFEAIKASQRVEAGTCDATAAYAKLTVRYRLYGPSTLGCSPDDPSLAPLSGFAEIVDAFSALPHE